jgi:hypothetical protein
MNAMPMRQLFSVMTILLAGLAMTSAVAAFLETRAVAVTAHAHAHVSPQPARLADR